MSMTYIFTTNTACFILVRTSVDSRLFHTINLHFSQSQVLSPTRNHNVDIATCHPSATEGFGDSSSDMFDRSTP